MGNTITYQGLGSGLDIATMVENLVKADITPLQEKHDNKLKSVNTELSALGQLKSSMSALQSSMENLSKISQYYKMKSSMSNADYFSAKVSEKAQPGTYQVQVQALAQAQSLSSTAFANSAATVGSGKITINLGTYSEDLTTFTANTKVKELTIDIKPGSDNLLAICDAINNAGSDVKASIINDQTGSRLSLTSTHTGVDYAMQIKSDIAALTYDPTTSDTSLTQNLAAQNSKVTINGFSIDGNTNQLSNVISGISLDLKQASTTQTITFTIERDQEQLTNTINDFIKKYNDCMTFLNNLTSYDREAKTMGYFHNDAQVKGLKLDLYKTVTGFISDNGGSLTDLRSIGIKTYGGKEALKHGTLEIDQLKFKEALDKNFTAVGGLFAKTVKATDPSIQVNSSDTDVPAGSYDVEINAFEAGTKLSGTIGGILGKSTDGVTLTGGGKYKSLSIDVLGGTTGKRGQIIVSDGIASKLDTLLDKYLDKNNNFEKRATQLSDKVKDLDKDQQNILEKSIDLKKRYNKQWNALDQLIGKMHDTSSMLSQVLDNLPTLTNKK